MRRNLNLVARSFYEMPCSFFGLLKEVWGLRKYTSDMREKASQAACDTIYIRYAKQGPVYGFFDV